MFRRVKDPGAAKITIKWSGYLTGDLRHARVFYCVMGGGAEDHAKKNASTGLEKAKGFIRQELGQTPTLGLFPQLDFAYDTSFEYGDKIERLLKELHKDE